MTPIEEPPAEALSLAAAATTIALAELAIEDIRKFQGYITTSDGRVLTENGEVFAKIITGAVNRGVLKAEIAKEFGVNKSTVSRWSAAQNLPQSYIRPHVITWIVKRLEQLRDEHERDRDFAQRLLSEAQRRKKAKS